MKTICALILGLPLLAVAQDRPKEPAGEIEVRLYVFHKDQKPVHPVHMVAALAVRHDNGKAKTYLMRLVPAGSPDALKEKPSAIRDLGPGHFAEFFAFTPVCLPEGEKTEAPPPPEAEDNKKPPTLTEWRRDTVHRGAYFRLVLPAPEAAQFSATVRMDDHSQTTRAVRFPFDPNDAPEPVIDRIDASVKKISVHMDKGEFGKIPLAVVPLLDDLDKLSGVDPADPAVNLEYERRWCVELAHRIDRASYRGDDDINELVTVFELKLDRIRSGLKLTAAKTPPAPKLEAK